MNGKEDAELSDGIPAILRNIYGPRSALVWRARNMLAVILGM